jgi:cell growth-regulating nucleolar protein
MVFFVCEGCNETLKKNQVDKHAAKCRVCSAVTCVDCSVTFYGDDYAAHTVCVSEAEKYEKTLYKGPKQKANPQDEWNDIIEAAVASPKAPPAMRHHLERIGALENIPRNPKKFANFVKNSVRIYDDKLIGELFSYISSFKPEKPAAANSGTREKTEPTPSTAAEVVEVSEVVEKTEKRKKEKKSKKPEVEDEPVEPESETNVEQTEQKKESKKKKKRKQDETDSEVIETPDEPEIQEPEPPKKAKKAKH